MGTDCPVAPHGTNLNELRHMAANGFTPAQALHAATLERRRADGPRRTSSARSSPASAPTSSCVDGDPLVFDDYEERIEQVWKDGVRVVPFA